MRRRIVSVDTPKRLAASPIDTFSTTVLLFGMGNSIGFCLGNRLGAARASSGRFQPGPAFYRGAIDHLLVAAPLYELLGAVDLTHFAPMAAYPKGRRASELPATRMPAGAPADHGRPAGRRWVGVRSW